MREARRALDDSLRRIRAQAGTGGIAAPSDEALIIEAAAAGPALAYLVTTRLGTTTLLARAAAPGKTESVEAIHNDACTTVELNALMVPTLDRASGGFRGGYLLGQLAMQPLLEASLDDVLMEVGEHVAVPLATSASASRQ